MWPGLPIFQEETGTWVISCARCLLKARGDVHRGRGWPLRSEQPAVSCGRLPRLVPKHAGHPRAGQAATPVLSAPRLPAPLTCFLPVELLGLDIPLERNRERFASFLFHVASCVRGLSHVVTGKQHSILFRG